MLRLDDYWVWDSWYVDDGERFHAFYLKAPRSLVDHELRHHAARIGHSVSVDLRNWHHLRDALSPGGRDAPDGLSTWTGSVTKGSDNLWHMFYTGIAREHTHDLQRIMHATSTDLTQWTKLSDFVLDADSRWYASFDAGGRQDWRDPWVFFDESDALWHMLITACLREGPQEQTGTIGHATSRDLQSWTVEPALSDMTHFRQLEVTQTLRVDDTCVVVWCMLAGDTHVPGMHSLTGTWTAPAASLVGPFDFDRAEPIEIRDTYAGRIVRDRDGVLNLLAFVDVDRDGSFGGYICDPIPLRLTDRGTLQPAD